MATCLRTVTMDATNYDASAIAYSRRERTALERCVPGRGEGHLVIDLSLRDGMFLCRKLHQSIIIITAGKHTWRFLGRVLVNKHDQAVMDVEETYCYPAHHI